jgi:hypothetical protein
MRRIPIVIAFILFAYVLTVATGVETINSSEEGGILQHWHEEQKEIAAGGGSGLGKMRGHSEFQILLLVFGVWVYPFSVVAASIFARHAITAKSKVDKGVLGGCTVICLVILARFISLGVYSAGMGIG